MTFSNSITIMTVFSKSIFLEGVVLNEKKTYFDAFSLIGQVENNSWNGIFTRALESGAHFAPLRAIAHFFRERERRYFEMSDE